MPATVIDLPPAFCTTQYATSRMPYTSSTAVRRMRSVENVDEVDFLSRPDDELVDSADHAEHRARQAGLEAAELRVDEPVDMRHAPDGDDQREPGEQRAQHLLVDDADAVLPLVHHVRAVARLVVVVLRPPQQHQAGAGRHQETRRPPASASAAPSVLKATLPSGLRSS